MILNTTKTRLQDDPVAAELVNLIEANSTDFELDDASVYYRFPIYKDGDEVVTARIIIVSPVHGAFVVSTSDARHLYEGADEITVID